MRVNERYGSDAVGSRMATLGRLLSGRYAQLTANCTNKNATHVSPAENKQDVQAAATEEMKTGSKARRLARASRP